MTSAVDTSVVIAALMSWHVDHERASRWLGNQLELESLVLPEPVAIESYSVMTRLPSQYRLGADDARRLLEENLSGVRVVGIPASSIWKFLREEASRGTIGGAVYDAAIIECAVRGGADEIASLNRDDFERLARDRVRIVEP